MGNVQHPQKVRRNIKHHETSTRTTAANNPASNINRKNFNMSNELLFSTRWNEVIIFDLGEQLSRPHHSYAKQQLNHKYVAVSIKYKQQLIGKKTFIENGHKNMLIKWDNSWGRSLGAEIICNAFKWWSGYLVVPGRSGFVIVNILLV